MDLDWTGNREEIQTDFYLFLLLLLKHSLQYLKIRIQDLI